MFDFTNKPKKDQAKDVKADIMNGLKALIPHKKKIKKAIDKDDMAVLQAMSPEELREDLIQVVTAYQLAVSSCVLLLENARKGKPIPGAIIQTANTLCRSSLEDHMEKTHHVKRTSGD